MAIDPILYHQVLTELVGDEGVRPYPYDDKTGKPVTLPTGGKLTIGIGWNLTDNGLPQDIIDELARRRINEADASCRRLFPDFEKASQNRKAALINMAFNMGAPRLMGFRKMIRAVNVGDWNGAATEAPSSAWATQVQRTRVKRITTQLLNG